MTGHIVCIRSTKRRVARRSVRIGLSARKCIGPILFERALRLVTSCKKSKALTEGRLTEGALTRSEHSDAFRARSHAPGDAAGARRRAYRSSVEIRRHSVLGVGLNCVVHVLDVNYDEKFYFSCERKFA